MTYQMPPPFLAVVSEKKPGPTKPPVPTPWKSSPGGPFVIPLKRIGRDTFDPVPPEYGNDKKIVACFAERLLPYGGIILVCDDHGEKLPPSELIPSRNLPQGILGWYSVTIDRPLMTIIGLPASKKGPREIKIILRKTEELSTKGYFIEREKRCEMTDPSGLPPEYERFEKAVINAYKVILERETP